MLTAGTVFRRSQHVFTRIPSYPGWRRILTLSSVEGPLYPPLSTKTLTEYYETEILPSFGHRPGLVCRKEDPRAHGGPPSENLGVVSHLAWNFGEFDRHIQALARGLLAMGIQKGDRVGVIMGNNSAYAMLQWACASIGAILTTMNPAYRFNELVDNLRLVNVKHLFVVPRIRSSGYVRDFSQAFPSMRSMAPGELQIEELPELRNIIVVDNTGEFKSDYDKLHIRSLVDWREILMWRDDRRLRAMQDAIQTSSSKDDVINLQFTSGTTGSPKAVSLTHFNLLNNAISVGGRMRLTSQDIVFLQLINKIIRLVLGNLAAWCRGACIVYPSPVFNPQEVVDSVAHERCTALHGVPTHFLNVMTEIERRREGGESIDISCLRTGIAAGSPIPIDLMKRLITYLNLVDLTNAYGMTETSPVSFQTAPNDPIIKRVETVGKVQPHVKAKIVDNDGNIVPVGVPGEIHIAGYLLQKGYWEDKVRTEAVMKRDESGTLWMHTGDEGIMDEEGYLRVVSRIKDIIIRGGENLFPVQIENALTADPTIREAAAVAVPDDNYGEVVGAFIVREHGTHQSREDVRQAVAQTINPQNAPAWVWFLGEDGLSEDLPKTASGKIMKHVLREWSKELSAKSIGRITAV